MPWALIVVGLGSLVGAEQKRPAWDQDPLGVIQMIHRPRWSKTRYGVGLEIFSKIQGLKNDFVVLRLMLNDHLEHIAIPKQRIVAHVELQAGDLSQLPDKVGLLLEDPQRDLGMHSDQQLLLSSLQRNPPDAPLDLANDRGRRINPAGPLAVIALLGERLEQRGADPLSRHFDQSQAGDLEGLGSGPVSPQMGPELVQDLVTVFLRLHIDEVTDDDAPDVPQAELARDLPGGLQVGLQDGVFRILLSLVPPRVDVDRYERLRGLDNDIAARREHRLLLERRLKFLFDSILVEE